MGLHHTNKTLGSTREGFSRAGRPGQEAPGNCICIMRFGNTATSWVIHDVPRPPACQPECRMWPDKQEGLDVVAEQGVPTWKHGQSHGLERSLAQVHFDTAPAARSLPGTWLSCSVLSGSPPWPAREGTPLSCHWKAESAGWAPRYYFWCKIRPTFAWRNVLTAHYDFRPVIICHFIACGESLGTRLWDAAESQLSWGYSRFSWGRSDSAGGRSWFANSGLCCGSPSTICPSDLNFSLLRLRMISQRRSRVIWMSPFT